MALSESGPQTAEAVSKKAKEMANGEVEFDQYAIMDSAKNVIDSVVDKALRGEESADVDGLKISVQNKLNELTESQDALARGFSELNNLLRLDATTINANIDTGWTDFSGDYDLNDWDDLDEFIVGVAGGEIQPKGGSDTTLARIDNLRGNLNTIKDATTRSGGATPGSMRWLRERGAF